MSSAIPVTPGMSGKMASNFFWNTYCVMMEPIGSLVYWNPPMSKAIVVNFLNSGCKTTIQYPLLKSVIVNLVIPWNFPMIFSMECV